MSSTDTISILPLLKRISNAIATVTPDEITDALTRAFQGQLSPVQTGALLTSMHYTSLDTQPSIIAAAAKAMRGAGMQIHRLEAPEAPHDRYGGGFVDIVGTGGDGHDTFNVSTTAAIVVAGCGLKVSKHGNRASTSASGSADLLTALGLNHQCITSSVVSQLFLDEKTKFCFLYAPVFHPAMRHIAPIRAELGHRTILNLLGPLVNPMDYSLDRGLEARIIGVGKTSLGRTFAETLVLLGVSKGMVVCGAEQLDEISPEGETLCWRLDGKGGIEEFRIHPTTTFGLETHGLKEVAGGKSPAENAEILKKLLRGSGEVKRGDAVRDFVAANAAALVVVAGLVEGAEEIVDGVIQGEKWKNGVKLVEEAMESGKAWAEWEKFLKVGQDVDEENQRLAAA